MSFEHKENKGSMFPNDQDGNQNRPVYKGTINIEGTLYTISAWNNEAKSGKKYLGLQVQLPLKREERAGSGTNNNSDMPF